MKPFKRFFFFSFLTTHQIAVAAIWNSIIRCTIAPTVRYSMIPQWVWRYVNIIVKYAAKRYWVRTILWNMQPKNMMAKAPISVSFATSSFYASVIWKCIVHTAVWQIRIVRGQYAIFAVENTIGHKNWKRTLSVCTVVRIIRKSAKNKSKWKEVEKQTVFCVFC